MKNKLNSVKLSVSVTALVIAVLSLVRFAKPYAFEISKLRQLDSIFIPLLSVICVLSIAFIIVFSFIKKTKGNYAPFGILISGLVMYLYSIVDSECMMKFLYLPVIQNNIPSTDIHVNVTTLHSAKMLAEAFNMILCAACVILLAASAVSVIRNIEINKNSKSLEVFFISLFIGFVCSYLIFSFVVKANGYASMFSIISIVLVVIGLINGVMDYIFTKNIVQR